jgi:hypothetical protein
MADPPRGVVERARSFWVEEARSLNHVPLVVALGDARSQEHPAHVNIERDIAAPQMHDLHAALSLEDLDRHRGLLLADALEPFEPVSELLRGRAVVPFASGEAAAGFATRALALCHPDERHPHTSPRFQVQGRTQIAEARSYPEASAKVETLPCIASPGCLSSRGRLEFVHELERTLRAVGR